MEILRDGQPWKSQEIQHLLKEEFDVKYHPDYLGKFLRELGLSYAKPRPKRPHRPENPEEMHWLEYVDLDGGDPESQVKYDKEFKRTDRSWNTSP